MRQGIAYRVVGGTKFYQRAEIKDLLAYLRVVVNSTDDLSLLRVINTPRRGLGDVAIGRLQNYAAENGVSLREALLCAADVAGFTGGAANACVRLGEGFAEWAEAAGVDETTKRRPPATDRETVAAAAEARRRWGHGRGARGRARPRGSPQGRRRGRRCGHREPCS